MTLKKTLPMLFVVLFASSLFAATPESAAPQKPFSGTWLTTVTPPADAPQAPFKLILSFTRDGLLLASGTAGEFPALGNPCHGEWSRDGDGAINLTYLCLDYDGGLQFTGMDKLRGTFTLDANQKLTGTLDLTNFDVHGDEVFEACCATVDGSRIEIERMVSQPAAVLRPFRP